MTAVNPVTAVVSSTIDDHLAMLEQLEAERYTHSNETLAQVRRRVALERPESPAQALARRRREEMAAARRAEDRRRLLVAAAVLEARERRGRSVG
ncbi:hypothetical protein QT381_02655 [Galbitalea sp. SE-J8]|uniref:hypothetical protein n=1 Tax=Galbitalea sp. SE-J8 TaxID=3054952 RepID=UPI00259CFC27|nr:hypothetical protein [Galbitalea sp. SE-J8]MDM4761904.1 hypothetical protein [Galbitalea sp. SE-J8]